MKNCVTATFLWLFAAGVAAGFWGIAFPEYTFVPGSVIVTTDEGEQLSEEEMPDGIELYEAIAAAEPEKIKIKWKILTWIGE